MKNLIENLLNSARKFNAFDFGVFKIALIFIGIILGAYFSSFFESIIILVWIIFIISFIWIVYKIFFKYYKN